jgi:hypothetical protein
MEALPDDSSPPADNPHLLVTARCLKDHGGRAVSARKRSERATGRPECDLSERLERSI